MSDPIVRVSCVRHTYPDRTEVHLCGLDFEVDRGQRVVVLGPNGCGKTTLLFHILGLLEPEEGEVSVFGVNPARHFNRIRERVGVLFQNVDEQIIGIAASIGFGQNRPITHGKRLKSGGISE